MDCELRDILPKYAMESEEKVGDGSLKEGEERREGIFFVYCLNKDSC